jgi:hypothetical protein
MALSAPRQTVLARPGQEELVSLLIFQQALFNIMCSVRSFRIPHLEKQLWDAFHRLDDRALSQTGFPSVTLQTPTSVMCEPHPPSRTNYCMRDPLLSFAVI